MSIDLNAFCNPKYHIESLRQPFMLCGYEYATDGVIAVRMKRENAGSSIKNDNVVDVLLRLFKVFPQEGFEPFEYEIPDDAACHYCDGTGLLKECDDCAGQGQFKHKSHWYDCQACDGNGEVSAEWDAPGDAYRCNVCMGTGKRTSGFEYKGGGLGTTPARLIATLPHLEFVWGKERDAKEFPTYGYFRFEGGEGVIAARRVWMEQP